MAKEPPDNAGMQFKNRPRRSFGEISNAESRAAAQNRLFVAVRGHVDDGCLWDLVVEQWRGTRLGPTARTERSEEHTSELQSLMRISYAVFCLKKQKLTLRKHTNTQHTTQT